MTRGRSALAALRDVTSSDVSREYRARPYKGSIRNKPAACKEGIKRAALIGPAVRLGNGIRDERRTAGRLSSRGELLHGANPGRRRRAFYLASKVENCA